MSDIKERLTNLTNIRGGFAAAAMAELAQDTLDHIATLEQESAANLQRALVAEKDAERYRWMRGASNQWGDDWQHLVGVFLDAEVDAAILADTSTQSTDHKNASINSQNIDTSEKT